jgi:Domain of unknown function (DUF4345)
MSATTSLSLRASVSQLPNVVLFIAGVVAAFVGLSLGAEPSQFYAAYGITLSESVSLKNEMRGTAGSLVAAGSVLVVATFRPRLRAVAAAVGALLYFGYAAGRATSMILDGFPHPNLASAAAVELALGMGCLWIYTQRSAVGLEQH